MNDGTAVFLEALSRLYDSELREPTALPGWTRAHLLAHVGFNARALQRLASWARTGERNPMYTSPEQRVAEIEDGATWDVSRVRNLVVTSASDLAADLDSLTDEQWRAEVVTAQGRTVQATELPWMRTREVWIHAVDLGARVSFDDFPADLCVALIDDVTARRSAQGKDVALRLQSDDGKTWDVAGAGEPVVVSGSVQQLAAWLTGRGAHGLESHRLLPSRDHAVLHTAVADPKHPRDRDHALLHAAGAELHDHDRAADLPELTPWL
jgi:maleylpyruvate isomerase